MQRQVIVQWFLPVTCLLYGHRHVKFDKSGCMVMSNNAYHTEVLPCLDELPRWQESFVISVILDLVALAILSMD